MNKALNSFRLFLCTFSGEDNFIIKKCTAGIQFTFASIGIFVIAIFVGCFASAYNFFDSLFQGNFLISFPIGIIWALLVANMYLLLLYTVSPTILPTKKNKDGINNNFFTLSMFFRISFMSLLAIIITQPLNVIFFSSSIESSLKKHIQEEKTKMIIISDSLLIKSEVSLFTEFNKKVKISCSHNQIQEVQNSLFSIEQKIKGDSLFIKQSKILFAELNKLENKYWLNQKEKILKASLLSYLTKLTNSEITSDENFLNEIESTKITNPILATDYKNYKDKLKIAIIQKIDNYQKLDFLISKSNFYIKKIQLILFENPFSWIVTLIGCLIFLLPIYFKYRVRDKTGFYEQKIELEKKIVLDEYSKFKENYSKLLQQNISRYNYKSLEELKTYLLKLKSINNQRFIALEKFIKDEYKEEIVSKYEYWADNPFRTINKFDNKNLAKEEEFLRTIYSEEI